MQSIGTLVSGCCCTMLVVVWPLSLQAPRVVRRLGEGRYVRLCRIWRADGRDGSLSDCVFDDGLRAIDRLF